MRRRTTMALAAFAAATALMLSGCQTASSQAEKTPDAAAVGQPPTTIKDVKDLKVAFFAAGTSNQHLQAANDEAKKYAGEEGFTLDIFDGQFDAQTQFDQMQTALTSGKYNVFAAEPNDGNLVCNMLTKQAPKAGILVTVFNLPICGRAANLGDDIWAPGTVTYVGGQTLDVYQAWVEQVKKAYPDGAKIALIAGPDLNANTINFYNAAEAFTKGDGYEVVGKQSTDYTTAQAFKAAQTMMQANPDLDVIMSNFSGMTRGVMQATTGSKVKVFDFGGDTWALDNVKSGVLASTIIMLPRQEAREALKAVVDLVKGNPVPKFINLTKSDKMPGGSPFVFSDNVGDYTAEY